MRLRSFRRGKRHRRLVHHRRRRLLGAATTRTSCAPSKTGSRANSSCAPANSQLSPSQTRTSRPGADFFKRGVVRLAALEFAFAAAVVAQFVNIGDGNDLHAGMLAG
jgi:hypothetical protein